MLKSQRLFHRGDLHAILFLQREVRLAIGVHRDLNEAFRISLRNTIDFLSRRARLTRHDAYALASMAVNFRVTQVVDVNQGVHAMIPKDIFARELRETIRVV